MRHLVICALVLLGGVSNLSAQESDVAFVSYFGNEQQPGNQLHMKILARVDNGESRKNAVISEIENSLTEESTLLTPDAKNTVGLDKELSGLFMEEMVEVNSLLTSTKMLVEEYPNKVVEIITLGVALYPDFAQEVIDAAALTGQISVEDALIAALQAGADPTSVGSATAANGTVSAPTPLGAGVGAGGAGGGDATASTN